MTALTSLEDQALRMLLEGENVVLAILRQQAEQARVSSRQMTGVGFYTAFTVHSEALRVPGRPSFKLGDVNGTAENEKHGLGFLLYVEDGALSMLEGYTCDETWPDEVLGLVLTHSGGRRRNPDSIRKLTH